MRSIADALRGFTESDLARLLRSRPDLCVPVPEGLPDLASRASTLASVRRALDELSRPQLIVAEALAALPEPIDIAAVAELVGFGVDQEIAVLQQLALAWGAAGAMHPVRGLRQAFEPFPGGLAAARPDPLPAEEIHTALLGLPTAAREVLGKLMWGPPTGAVRHADRNVTEPFTPIDHLLARGLLRAVDPATVVLPREVALRLRGGFAREPLDGPPAPPPDGPRAGRIIDSAAVGAAFELVHELEGVLDELGHRGPAPLRAGGLAARDLGVIARIAGASLERTGFLLEVALAADLISTSGAAIVPTDAFDRWLELPLVARYHQVLRAWWTAPRWFAATRVPPGRPLMAEAEAGWASQLRAQLVAPLSAGAGVVTADLAAHAAWHRPALQRAGDLTELTGAVLIEAEWLGLTAVATGPLDRRTAAGLALLADVESRGGGGVFRFSKSSLRRAFDVGWTTQQVEEWLATHSRTGVPQPLRYLVGDVARVHGTVRVGAARAYVRIDDPARLRTVLAHPEAAALGVRQVGPEALVADANPDEVVALLRSLGLAPAAENAAGEVLTSPGVRRPPRPCDTGRSHRTPTPSPPRWWPAGPLTGWACVPRRRSRCSAAPMPSPGPCGWTMSTLTGAVPAPCWCRWNFRPEWYAWSASELRCRSRWPEPAGEPD